MNDLNTGLRELAERDAIPPAPVEQLMNRGKRARRARAGMSAAALGAVAAIAVGVMGTVGDAPDTSTQVASDTSTQVAQPRLVAAAAQTAQTTFRLVVTADGPESTWRQEGVYDPVARKGYLRWTDSHGNQYEQRIIDDELYLIGMVDGKPNQPRKMGEAKGFSFRLTAGDRTSTLSVDPAELLATLRSLGAVEDLGGGRYSFTNEDGTSGTVEVAADSGKVAKVTYQLAKDRVLTLEFSDFGTPVAVERP